MRRELMIAVALLLLGTLLIAGCKDVAPQTALDRFMERTGVLEGQALEDTLRALAAGEKPASVYANYLIGNRFYVAAGDSAQATGWDAPGVMALLDSAEVYFGTAVAQDSTFIEALVNLGALWDDRAQQLGGRVQRDEKLAQAETFYQLALDVDPADQKARCNLGALYLRQRKTDEALTEFQTALEHDPHSALAHYNLAIMFAESKLYREAIVEWEAAVKADPEGDIGSRSRDNVQIVKDLMNAASPETVQ